MQKYLAFIDEIGRTINGDYIYRFDFTNEPDTFWGEEFNVSPSIVVPNLQPDKLNVSMSGRVEIPYKLNIAKKSGCFSMQDCFDHIISLGFTNISNEEQLIFDFGETLETVNKKLSDNSLKMNDIIEYDEESEKLIDDFIDSIKPEISEEENHSDLYEIDLYEEILTLKVGNSISFDSINQILFDNGYERIDYIHKKAQYTIRGHIIDIFSIYYKDKNPYRIEFFGNEIEKIYSFDIKEQTKIDEYEEITIYKVKSNA